MALITSFTDSAPTMQRLGGEMVLVTKELDFSVTNAAIADVVEAISIPAGAFVTGVWTYINTAEGGVATADVGDGADANGWDAVVNLNATAGTVARTLQGTDAYAVGKYYSSEDTIDIVPTAALDACVVTVIALYAVIENVS
jgi:hypothetical protein